MKNGVVAKIWPVTGRLLEVEVVGLPWRIEDWRAGLLSFDNPNGGDQCKIFCASNEACADMTKEWAIQFGHQASMVAVGLAYHGLDLDFIEFGPVDEADPGRRVMMVGLVVDYSPDLEADIINGLRQGLGVESVTVAMESTQLVAA